MVPVFGRFVPGSLFLVPRSWALRLLLDGRFIPWSSFLGPSSWALCLLLNGRFILGSRFLACLRVITRCFKGRFVGGSIRVIEDILLSECDNRCESKGNGRVSCT
jgi:hypothetical protein